MNSNNVKIVKDYPARGPLHQYRLGESTAFRCFRCGDSKKSKLIALYDDNWERLLCNGCYGRLLSIYDIKAGTTSDDEKAAELASLLLSLLVPNQQREAERLFQLSENRAQYLSPHSLRFVASSEYASNAFQSGPDLEWSPVIIGLCKAVEAEVVERIIIPLSRAVAGISLDADIRDKDIWRVARFCADSMTAKPPELGSFAHFLQTAVNSESRRATSPIFRALFQLFASWPDAGWLTEAQGLHASIDRLTKDYRNRAAHTDSLTQSDYNACRELVIGPNGILWRIILATKPR